MVMVAAMAVVMVEAVAAGAVADTAKIYNTNLGAQKMSDEPKNPDSPNVSRRDVLKSVSKYSAAAAGASVVAITASEALAQASTSDEWNCRDYYPWWICWWFGFQEGPETPKYGGWNDFPENRNLQDGWRKDFN